MQWVIVAGFLVTLVGCGGGSVIKCTPESQHGPCSENTKIDLPPPDVSSKDSPRQVECLGGSEWESNCHYCRCSDSGVAECLKRETCDNGVFAEPLQCKPNTTFQRDCNTCVCLENGLALCTIEFCRRTGIPKKSELLSGKDCAPGSSWKDRCNDCRCSDAGYGVCNVTFCEEQATGPEMRCAPDTVWRNDCNTCWCTTQGRAMCTKIGCVAITNYNKKEDSETSNDQEFTGPNSSLSRKVRATPQLETGKNCQPGQEFRLDCNSCLCDNEGLDFSCTRIDCNNNNGGARSKREVGDLKEIPAECTPGSVFQQDCDACRCTNDGHHALCTTRQCQKEEGNGNNLDSNVHNTESDPGFRCTPGEQLRRDCNDCTCAADGKSIFCTLRLCDQDITPGV